MLFRIRALDVTNRITQLQIEASDEISARAQVQADGLTVLSAARAHTLSLNRQRFPVLLFCQELLALLRSGLSLVEGLEFIGCGVALGLQPLEETALDFGPVFFLFTQMPFTCKECFIPSVFEGLS